MGSPGVRLPYFSEWLARHLERDDPLPEEKLLQLRRLLNQEHNQRRLTNLSDLESPPPAAKGGRRDEMVESIDTRRQEATYEVDGALDRSATKESSFLRMGSKEVEVNAERELLKTHTRQLLLPVSPPYTFHQGWEEGATSHGVLSRYLLGGAKSLS